MLLVLSLVTLRYVDEANLPGWLKSFARHSIPAAAVLLPAAFFLSVLSPEATEPNAMIYLAFVGAVVLASGKPEAGAPAKVSGIVRFVKPAGDQR